MDDVKKQVSFIYDTFKDVILDVNNFYVGMVVTTLGFNEVDDGKANTYIIKNKNDEKMNISDGDTSLGRNTPYFARRINKDTKDSVDFTPDINRLKNQINELCNAMVKEEKQKSEPETIEEDILTFTDKENKIMIYKIDGRCFVTNNDDSKSKVDIMIDIDDTNDWIIPTEFVITNYKVNKKKIGTGSFITYNDKKLTITIDFSKPDNYVLSY